MVRLTLSWVNFGLLVAIYAINHTAAWVALGLLVAYVIGVRKYQHERSTGSGLRVDATGHAG
jgi:hypothetical protein